MSSLILITHIIFGSIALISIVFAMASKKGGKNHRLAGKVYVYSMLIGLVAAIILSVTSANLFLFLIAIFSGYLLYTGWRLAADKNTIFTVFDKCLVITMLVGAIAMFAIGIWMYFQGDGLSTVLIVFAFIGGGFALVDGKRMILNSSNSTAPGWPIGRERIVLHIIRISSACISTITAVAVVNVQTEPKFIAWLLPTVVVVPIIIYWVRRVKTRGLQ